MTGASGRQRVQRAFFDEYEIVHPDDNTLGRFSDFVSPMFDEIHVLAQKNKKLREARDLLLPRLIKPRKTLSAFCLYHQLEIGQYIMRLN